MASAVGRLVKITYDGTLVAGARTKNVTINNEPVDVTTDDDDGWRRLLEDSAESQIDASVEGLAKDAVLFKQATNRTGLIATTEIELFNGDTITCDMRLNNVEIGAEYNDAVTFTAQLQSTGEPTYADAV